MKRFLCFATAAVLSVSMIGCGSSVSEESSNSSAEAGTEEQSATSGPEVTLKVAIGVPQSHKDMGQKFKEVLEAETDGKIQVNLFEDNSLGADREVLESVQMGEIDITLSSTAPLAATYSDLYLLDTPFLFPSREKAYEILDGEVGDLLAEGLIEKNLMILSYPENGYRNLTTADTAVSTPDDLSGLKIRVMENAIQMATWEMLGSNPTPMSFAEVFTALQQGTIDGQENPIELIYDNKLFEVQGNITMTQHTYSALVFAMTNDTFAALPIEYQEAIQYAADVATAYSRETAAIYDEECLQKIIDEKPSINIIELTDDEMASFRASVLDANDMIKEEMDNPELLDIALEIANS